MAQDIRVAMPSVTVLAYVRADGPNVSGALAIWDLDANRNNFIPFTVGQTWTQLTTVLGLDNAAARPVRIEFYNSSINTDLLVDSVSAF
jgi:hypothetical protein